MANIIKLKYSDTVSAVPTLDAGEIAINRVDKKLFYTDNLNVVQEFSLSPLPISQIDAASALIKTQNTITQLLIK